MANQQLVDYIKSQLAAGVTKADLQKAVNTAGWSQQDSDEAFAVAEGKAPVAAATPVAPVAPVAKPAAPAQPAQPIQQSVQQPVQQPVQPVQPQPAQPIQPIQPVQTQPIQPVQQPVQPIQPVKPVMPMAQTMPQSTPMTASPNLGGPMRASTMQMNVQATNPRRHTLLWATLITILVLVAAGAAAYYFLPPVQEVVNFYLQGGQAQVPLDSGVPAGTTPATTTTQTEVPVMPVATSSASTTTSTQTSGTVVASTSASTTLRH